MSRHLDAQSEKRDGAEAMEAVRALYGYEYEVQGKRIIVPSLPCRRVFII